MPGRMIYKIHQALEQKFPEKRLFLKSDTETRFIRLRPVTQLAALVISSILFVWTVLASAILMIDSLGAGSSRDQTARDQVVYEQRLTALARDRDERTLEALGAQERFNQALAQVSQMQSLLLASEDRRKEVETGLDVVQLTLRRVIRERDEARQEMQRLQGSLAEQGGEGSQEALRARDTAASLGIVSEALQATASERDVMARVADAARIEAQTITRAKNALEARNHEIFTKLEEAVSVSMEPLNKMFRAAGLNPDEVLRQVRRGYSGEGGPLGPLRLSTKLGGDAPEDELRANAIMSGLDRMALYRLAAMRIPLAMPVAGSFRQTSGFGYRRDPKGGGTRMHSGTDFAGARGTPIIAAGSGVVTKAGWHAGYGNAVIIQHEFGIETLYAHMSKIHVREGQSVSRGARIGDMGTTGRSTGVHLHYEVRVSGKAVNPMTYIKAANNVF